MNQETYEKLKYYERKIAKLDGLIEIFKALVKKEEKGNEKIDQQNLNLVG
jgi:hypothetical protein